MSLTFNQFQKELINRNIDKQLAYMLTLIYERVIEISEDLDTQASAILAFANMMEGFVVLRSADQEVMKRFKDRNRVEGVDVHSVANDPEDNR